MAPGLYHPHGKASGFSYGLTGQWQHVGRKGLLAGFQLGYESLTSRLSVNELVGDFYFGDNTVDGQGWLKNQYVLLQPFAGKRFGTAKASLDVTAGVDLAYGLSSRDSYSIWVAGEEKLGLNGTDHDMPTVDVRPRISLTGYYRSFGLNVGYSFGLTNYTPNSRYDNTSVYSQYWRAGLSYRFGRRG